MRKLAALLACLSALLAPPPPYAQAAPGESRDGLAVGTFLSRFVGGDSGPVTPLSETRYSDTFGSGSGLRLEAYRNYESGWRAQLGLVHVTWDGRFFTGGEFPAGAQFEDFSLSGLYAGARATLGGPGGLQPYLLGNLGLAYLSSLSVVSGGATVPYWSGNWRDFVELGAGVARRTQGGTWTLDLRMQTFGKPKAATWPIGAATAGTSFLLGIGYEWERR